MIRATILSVILFSAFTAVAQTEPCQAHITPIPFSGKHLTVPAGAHLPKGAFIRFEYPLQDGYTLLLSSVPDDFPLSHYGDRGIQLIHNNQSAGEYPLRTLSIMRGEDEYIRNNFQALSVVQTCSGDKPIFFIAFGYRGDMTSADLFIAIIPASDGYQLKPLPMVAGGVLELSKSNPLLIRTWSNLFEGECNACPTRYEIIEYRLIDGTPQKIRSYRTRKLYSSDDALFDDRLRIHISK
jgi:hypothetical protein